MVVLLRMTNLSSRERMGMGMRHLVVAVVVVVVVMVVVVVVATAVKAAPPVLPPTTCPAAPRPACGDAVRRRSADSHRAEGSGAARAGRG